MSAAGPFAGPAPRWLTIAPHRPFLHDLACGLHKALGPEGLAGAQVLLPSRRSVRALAEAFLAVAGGKALLLPQIRALGDLDEGEAPFEPGEIAEALPAAITPFRRRFELARLAAENAQILERELDATGALELADVLASFLDSLEIEEVDEAGRLDAVERLVPAELARHWRISADFLAVALQAWPRRLQALGLVDPTARRVKLLRALARQWSDRPPSFPLIAAGSTGTAPAAADLLARIARLTQGAVVLPGLDQDLADSAWDKVGEQHPQGAMKRLLERAKVERGAVRPWPFAGPPSEGRWRRRIVNEALRPAEATDDWIGQIRNLRDEGGEGPDPIAEGLSGLALVAAREEEEAAAIAALLMREALETPGKTCALITPDQALARRAAARLSRWGLEVDSSAGASLANTPVGVLAGLLANAALDPADPVLLLAILKHPLVRLGIEEGALRRGRSAIERLALRGPRRPGEDWIEVALALAARRREDDTDEAHAARLDALADAEHVLGLYKAALARACAPYTGGTATPAEAARGLVQALEALAADDGGDPGPVWAGPDGEAAAGLFAALIGESEGLPEAQPRDFAELVLRLIEQETVRIIRAAHPRLKILGAIESRLVAADRLILAGLEEGVWPQGAPIDPFLSRPMRKALGLPPPERRIGLSAHDFAQAACAPEVVLLHCERREGAPTVQSRWLWRLKTLARGAGLELPARPELASWARALDEPLPFTPARRPAPCPPAEARPVELPVTGVETWVRDPYAVYARYVLKLRPLNRPDEPVEARARGEAMHLALQRFAESFPDDLPPDAAERMRVLFLDALSDVGMSDAAMARESALAARAAPWVVGFERRRRRGARLLVEQKGTLVFDPGGGPFKLTARADRLELRDGVADILDFKTGLAPTRRQVEVGFSPQLTLTAAILAGGGFEAAGQAQPGELVYVRLTGGRKPGEELVRAGAGESAAWAETALDGLKRRVLRFRDPDVAYVSWAAPQFMYERGGDYDHLARVWEWHVIGAEEGGE